jgi:uncharacterized protein
MPPSPFGDANLRDGQAARSWRSRTVSIGPQSLAHVCRRAHSGQMAELIREADIVNVLERSRVVAVLGAHREPHRAAFYVPDYLHGQGYRVLPVNPQLAGQTLWGEPVVARVTDLAEPVDLVDVFRRPDALDAHLDELLAMKPAPGAIWFQLGIRNDRVAAALVAAGLDVVQDRCTLADHKRFRRSGLLAAR